MSAGDRSLLDVEPSEGNRPRQTHGRGASIVVDSVTQAFVSRGDDAHVVALDEVSLEVPSGQFTALVGPSGCGKTTVLNLTAGLQRPLAGTVRINDEVITKPTVHTGFMFARDALLPWRTAVENVEVGLQIRGIRRQERRARALPALEMVGLAGFATYYPRQLSQGMRQRVAIARTLAMDPDTLLMDEPFAALDAQTRLRIQQEFVGIWEATGKTVLFVTHDIAEAVLLADRVVVFAPRPGRIIGDFEIDLPRPRNTETLRFDARYLALHEQVWQRLKEGEAS
jgi:NitT/TauT family transport system ATP-binding protein